MFRVSVGFGPFAQATTGNDTYSYPTVPYVCESVRRHARSSPAQNTRNDPDTCIHAHTHTEAHYRGGERLPPGPRRIFSGTCTPNPLLIGSWGRARSGSCAAFNTSKTAAQMPFSLHGDVLWQWPAIIAALIEFFASAISPRKARAPVIKETAPQHLLMQSEHSTLRSMDNCACGTETSGDRNGAGCCLP